MINAHLHGVGHVVTARHHAAAHRTLYRLRLTRHQRFVGKCVADDQCAICGERLARQDANHIADFQSPHGNSLEAAVGVQPLHRVWQALHQHLQRARGSGAQALLQPAARQQKEDKHREGIKIHLMPPPALRLKRGGAANGKSHCDAQRHRQIHADAALSQVSPSIPKKRPARKQHHRQAEHP